MNLGRAVKALLRINSGFAIVRINSLGKVYPGKTSVDVLELFRRKLRKK
ncbi:hypothetical protein [Thermococcus thioreducens]|uniref:Uncharacterized protein n=1 Tax=Thermococcus thioreducens TaxID=277988 RepID=A0A1I0M0S0_9EURY|nr:hypothetical protein [Thermococcus thioreducens]SEV81997.1 hypothetical protein SAMN05216170_0109 [Thermococcus thioreducens]